MFQNQLSPLSKSTYREYLAKLDLQYAKLLVSIVLLVTFCNILFSLVEALSDMILVCVQNSSKSRLRHLDQLHAFVGAATKELMWLNDKEEEEVNFDWSDRNTNMTAKKENYSVRPI